MIRAVVFDLDGVLLDSEHVWDEVREQLVRERGGRWHDRAQREMMGMSSREWSRYMREALGIDMPPEQISAAVVERLAEHWPLGVASSSNRELIDLALELLDVADRFDASVSSEEVERGKPAPDVYLEAARRLDVQPTEAAAIEDSHNGILAAKAAGLRVLAIPNRRFPPGGDALAQADVVLRSLVGLTAEAVSPTS